MRCSLASLTRDEPLAGTAPTARRWLMVEVSQGWDAQPLNTPPLDGPAREALGRAEAERDATVLLVRRPGRSRDLGPARRWWAVDTLTRRQVGGLWSDPGDLVGAAAALGEELDHSARPADLALLVCTHGTRDQCCAIDGRPLARDLAVRWPEAVWECTHLGGHRFAPTFAVLPDGAVYGRVPSGDGPAVVEDHLGGRVRGDLLRGVSRYAPHEQAALAAGHCDLGPARLGDIGLGSVEPAGELTWRVGLRTPAGERLLVVTATPQPPMPLSCGPAKAKKSMTYAVSSPGPLPG